MKIVTLCGSMRFTELMQVIAMELETKYGYCVICPINAPNTVLDDDDLENLSKAHYRKIDIADIVYIVNVNGYIGESVSKELQYAKSRNKEIIYHEAVSCG